MNINSLFLKIANFLLPMKNVIIFESVPDLSDNTKPVFDEMVRRGLNKKYKLIWAVKENSQQYSKNNDIPNVRFVTNIQLNNETSKLNKILYYYYWLTAKCFISCNSFFLKAKNTQISIYLAHGTQLKSIRNICPVPELVDYILTASKDVNDIVSYDCRIPVEKIFSLGYPRNEILKNHSKRTREILHLDKEKIIVWYPTYRQHNIYSDTHNHSSISIPIIHNEEKAYVLNSAAKKENVVIVLKPHFAQDVSKIKDLNLSNILFINDDFYKNNEISSYEFISGCDAMLSDYSSVYFDYTLCDCPIGLIWEDVEEYRQKIGFAKGIDRYLDGGEKLYTLDDLLAFIHRVANNEDLLKERRNEIKCLVNKNVDNNCIGDVVDFIITKAGL